METKRGRNFVGATACVALTGSVILGVPYSSAHLIPPARAAAAVESQTSAPPVARSGERIASIRGLGPGSKRRITVLGVAGIPRTGVTQVRAKVVVRTQSKGAIRVSAAGVSGSATRINAKPNRTTRSTVLKQVGSSGSWTIRNLGRAKVTVTLKARGYNSSTTTPTPSGTPSGQSFASLGACGTTSVTPNWEHVVWVVLENHGPASVAARAPYLSSIGSACGSATNMWARTRPSLPNYIALTSGSRQGITDSGLPAAHPLAVDNIFNQLDGDWQTLAQSMPSNCLKTNSGDYVARHNPATYYTNLNSTCPSQNVPMGVTPDLSAKFTLVVPDNYHNGHDAGIEVADDWLQSYMPKIINSTQYQAGKMAVFVFFDESEGWEAVENHINMFVVSPSTPVGTQDSTHFTHYSTLRTTQEMLGLTPLLMGAASATDMRSAFNLD